MFGPIKPSSPLGPYLAHSGMQPRGLMEGALAEAETDGGAADEPTTVNVKLPDETPTTWPALVECVTACFAQLCDDYAGPMQYLNLCYPDAAAREQFGD